MPITCPSCKALAMEGAATCAVCHQPLHGAPAPLPPPPGMGGGGGMGGGMGGMGKPGGMGGGAPAGGMGGMGGGMGGAMGGSGGGMTKPMGGMPGGMAGGMPGGAPLPPPSGGAGAPLPPPPGMTGAMGAARPAPLPPPPGMGGATSSASPDPMDFVQSFFQKIKHPSGRDVVVGACKKDKQDDRDVHYSKHKDIPILGLPPLIDLRNYMTAVEDQGALGSCTANAIAGAYEYMQKRITGKDGDVSRLFVYWLERKQENAVDQDSGAALRDGIKVLKTYGVCSERTWPYRIAAFKEEPSKAAFEEAASHRIDEYHRIPIELHAMKVCLVEGYPFVFGITIFESFEEDGNHGHIRMPTGRERELGGHAMLCVGYNEHDRVFIVRNSWGNDWGDAGYCYIPFDYLSNQQLAQDLWTLRVTHNLDFSTFRQQGDVGSAADYHKNR
jgi:hypothetical protein